MAGQIIEVVQASRTITVQPMGVPGPRGRPGIGSALTFEFDSGNWESDPDFSNAVRLVTEFDSMILDVWKSSGGIDTLMTDTLVIRRETISGENRVVVRTGSGGEFSGFVAYYPV